MSFVGVLLLFSFTLGQAGTLIAFADESVDAALDAGADSGTTTTPEDGTVVDAATPEADPVDEPDAGTVSSDPSPSPTLTPDDPSGGGSQPAPERDSDAKPRTSRPLQALASPLDPGDVSLDFLAAGPFTYDHTTGLGGAYDDRTISKTNGVVESLEGGDFKCGDLVVYFTAITVDPGDGSGSVELDYEFDGETTSGDPVGFNDLVSASINQNPPDSGNTGDGDEDVQVLSEQYFGGSNRRLEASVRVDGVEGGEQVILRLVVRLYCDPATKISGNILSAIPSAAVTGEGRIPVGEQTVPLKQAGNILVPGLNVTKSCPATATVGDTIDYEITVSNTGQDTLNDLVVSDPLLGGALAGFPTSLAPGQSESRIFSHTLAASPDPLVNTVTATAKAQSSTATLTDTADCTVDVLFPDLSVDKTADPAGPVSAGDRIGFDIEVTNGGPGTAHGIVLSDTLPTNAGLAWSIDGTIGGWSCDISADVLTCGGPNFDLAAGASASVRIESRTTEQSCAVISNSAVADAENDGRVEDGDDVAVRCPDLSVEKSADADEVNAGDEVGYTATVTNGGPGTAYGVVLSDTLPTNAGLAWSIDGTTGGWSCDIAAGVLTCGGPNFDLAAGASASVHLVSDTTSATCGTIWNVATADADNDDLVSSDIAAIEVDCAAIDIEKTADASPVDAADEIGFTITATNEGAGIARDVTMTDTLPTDAGLAWSVEATTGGWSCTIAAGELRCGGLGFDLASGATVTVHIVSDTDATTCGVVENVASVTTSNDGTDSDAADVTVNCPTLGIAIQKGGPALAHVGDTIAYTFDVSLASPEPLYDVAVSDLLCASAPSLTGKTGGDQDDVLEPGDVWGYTCDHVVADTDPDPLPNTATAVGTADDGRQTTATDDHLVNLIHPAIRIVKTVNPTSGEPGDVVTYTYRVKNTGDTTLYGVTVEDDVIGHIGDIAELQPSETVILTKDYVLPNDATLVVNVAVASGEDELGEEVSDDDDAGVTIVLPESPTPNPPTAFTGGDPGAMALVALTLLLLGMIASAIGRRRTDEG